MKNRRAVGLLNPIRDKKWRQQPGGRRNDTCDHALSRSWKVDLCEKKEYAHGRYSAYQVILEPGIGQFREFEPPPSAYSYKFVGTFSCAQNWLAESARAWVSNTIRWKIDDQLDCWTLCAIKIEGKKRGEGMTPMTTTLSRSWKVYGKCAKKKRKKVYVVTSSSVGATW